MQIKDISSVSVSPLLILTIVCLFSLFVTIALSFIRLHPVTHLFTVFSAL
jgi:ABC-type protease/lipase transport system fused ATPase/permease subunit